MSIRIFSGRVGWVRIFAGRLVVAIWCDLFSGRDVRASKNGSVVPKNNQAQSLLF